MSPPGHRTCVLGASECIGILAGMNEYSREVSTQCGLHPGGHRLGQRTIYAASFLLNKRLSRSFDASEMIVYHTPTALLALALAVPAGGWTIAAPSLAWLVLGALGPGALAGIVFMRGLAVVPAAHASVLTLVEPVTALALAVFLWREPLDALGLPAAPPS